MKFKILVILFFLVILSPFLLHRYNKDLSKKFVEYYINSRFSRFSASARISFSDFNLVKSDNIWEIVLDNIRITHKSKEIACIEKASLSFSWNFPFTKLQPLSVTVWDTSLQIPLENQGKNLPVLEDKLVDRLFSLITLLNTDVFVKKLKFNSYGINEGFIRIKKMNHKKVLQIGIHEEKGDMEIEIIQSQYDTIAVKVTHFNPNKSVFSPLIREFSEIKFADDDFSFSGYVLFNLNEKKIDGIVQDLHGSTKRNGKNFHFDNGKCIIRGNANKIELNDVKINIDGNEFAGTLILTDSVSIQGKIGNLSSADVLRYWEKNSSSEAREWYAKHIKDGLIKEAEIKLDSKSGNLEIRNVHFEGVRAEIDPFRGKNTTKQTIYLDGFSGNLSLVNNNLEIVSTAGKIDGLPCQSCKVTANQLHTEIEGSISGSLETVISLGKKSVPDTISTIEKHMNLEALKGKSKATASLKIPRSGSKQVSTKLRIEADAVQGEKFYRDFSISSGTANLEMDDNEVKIDANLISSKESINITLVRDFADRTTNIAISGTSPVKSIRNSGFLPTLIPLEGKVSGKITVQIPQSGDLYLDGHLNIKEVEDDFRQLFGWEKDPTALFTFRINKVGDTYNFEQLDVNGKNLELSLTGNSNAESTFLKSKALKINNSNLNFTYSLKQDVSNLVISSEALDFSGAKKIAPMLNFSGGRNNRKDNIEINIGTLKLKNDFLLSRLQMKLINGDGNLSGIFSDGTILGASFSKRGGIIVDTTNVGTLLKSLGTKSGIIGGRASFYLGTKDTRSNDGVIVVENFYMQDVPVLARILSLSSLYGIMNVLNGEGIFFEKFFSQFRYSDGIFYISESWLEAAPIGLSVMGILSLTEGEAIIHGNVVPLYRLNKLISKLPIIGMLVTAGKSRGIIAAEYTLTRKLGKSNVSVNTLTTFTPTILHKFFKVFNLTS